MQRVLIEPRNVSGSLITVDDPKVLHHLRVVLRLKRGDQVVCFDGQGSEYRGAIRDLSSRRMTVAIDRQQRCSSTGPSIWLIPALIKGDRFDWLVQKATELGVSRISPLLTERTVVRLSPEQARKKQTRWQRIAQEAAKQSRRSTVPVIEAPQPLEAALPQLARVSQLLIPTLTVHAISLKEALREGHRGGEAAVLIGPEGDFSPREVQRVVAAGAQPVSLGHLTLRSETAAIAMVAMLTYELETS